MVDCLRDIRQQMHHRMALASSGYPENGHRTCCVGAHLASHAPLLKPLLVQGRPYGRMRGIAPVVAVVYQVEQGLRNSHGLRGGDDDGTQVVSDFARVLQGLRELLRPERMA